MQNDENKVKKSFFQGMKSELKKVVWPTARQTAKNTLVTIMFVLLVSIILIVCNIVFDFISTKWYDLILGRTNNNNNEVINSAVSGEVISGESEEEPALPAGTEESGEEEDNGEPVGEVAEESVEEAE